MPEPPHRPPSWWMPKIPAPAPPANLTPEQLSRRKRVNAVVLSGIALTLCCCGGVLLFSGGDDDGDQPQPAGSASATAPATAPASASPAASTPVVQLSTRPSVTAAASPRPKASPSPRRSPSTRPPAPPEPTRAKVPDTVYYANCDAVRAAGAAPLYAGEPGYSFKLDRDRDGVACET
ncbi:excalibur calcium-binding domain-containing protein [Melissospora conviva]|uniref:excalibur calcium-binding domain-containing protein n=1 Tax=Melissospora conviva TaxID=3388432 RepID=UPI003C20183A